MIVKGSPGSSETLATYPTTCEGSVTHGQPSGPRPVAQSVLFLKSPARIIVPLRMWFTGTRGLDLVAQQDESVAARSRTDANFVRRSLMAAYYKLTEFI